MLFRLLAELLLATAGSLPALLLSSGWTLSCKGALDVQDCLHWCFSSKQAHDWLTATSSLLVPLLGLAEH